MEEVKFLADVNVERPIVQFLTAQGYDVKWIADYNSALCDEDLINLANAEKRILVTNDKDFGELVFLQKRIPAGVILFRVKGQRVDDKITVLRELMQRYRHRLLTHFVVLTERKIRIIPLEELQ
jgi:predicted nuclease of predicted toxin-antitoxin system